eukprot:403352953
MSTKRQQSSQHLNTQQQQPQYSGSHNRPNSFSKAQNLGQTYSYFNGQPQQNNGNGDNGAIYGGATPERKQSTNNYNASLTHLNEGETSARGNSGGGSFIKGSRIAIINSYQQIQNKINIPSISPIRLGNPKQTALINNSTRNHNYNQSSQQSHKKSISSSSKTVGSLGTGSIGTGSTGTAGATQSHNNNIPQLNNGAMTTRIDLSKSIQDTYNFIQAAQNAAIQQSQQPTQQQNAQIVINQQIQQQDDGNLAYAKEKIRKLKDENKKLHTLLNETEERFKSKLDQTRKESENIMKVFNQILPILKQAMIQQQNNGGQISQLQTINVQQQQQFDFAEAQNIIKFLEMSSTTTPQNANDQRNQTQLNGNQGEQIQQLQDRIVNLEEEVIQLKDTNQKYLKYIQQQMISQKSQEQELQKLRNQCNELQAYKRSVDLYFSNPLSFNNNDTRRQIHKGNESNSTFNDNISQCNANSNLDPTPSFIKATMIIGFEGLDDIDNEINLENQKSNDLPDLYQQQSSSSSNPNFYNNQQLSTNDQSPVKTSNINLVTSMNPNDNKLIEENIKQLMPNAIKKSRSSSSPFTMNNNFIKYNINEFKQ